MCCLLSRSGGANSATTAIHAALSSHSSLLASASLCDGPLLTRLHINTTDAMSHVSSAISSLSGALAKCVASFMSGTRRYSHSVDKRLEMMEDELSDTLDTISACLHQCISDNIVYSYSTHLEDSVSSVDTLLHGLVNALPDVSIVVSPKGGDVLGYIEAATRIQGEVDTAASSCTISHARWLPREQVNSVSITLADSSGIPVLGATPDVVTAAFGRACGGWSVESVTVDANIVILQLSLTATCDDETLLTAEIGSARFELGLQVSTHAYYVSSSSQFMHGPTSL